MSNQCVRIFVTGRVQGVFFRQSLKAKSIQNNIFGWVKNLQDGRVECLLEGTKENISILVNGFIKVLQMQLLKMLKLIMRNLIMNLQSLMFCISGYFHMLF